MPVKHADPSWWFVHIDEPYYPSACVVRAVDAADAIRIAWGDGHHDDEEDRISFAVARLDDVIFAGTSDELEDYFGENDDPDDEPLLHAIPMPPGILPSPLPPAEVNRRALRMHAMATFAVISSPHEPEGYNPNPYGEHTPPKPEEPA